MASPESAIETEEEEELVFLPTNSREPLPLPDDALDPNAFYGICNVCDTLRPGACIKTTRITFSGKVRDVYRFVYHCSDYEPCGEAANQLPAFEMYEPNLRSKT